MISFNQVSLRLNSSEGPRLVLSGISCDAMKGILVIGGPSGAGKTSLVRMINGLSSPTEGEIHVLGKRIEEWTPKHLRQKVGCVAQQPVALTTSAEEDLKLAASLAEQNYDADFSKECFERLGLKVEMLSQSAANFSVGERQRFALVRALCAQPEILILDEPTSALDEDRAEDVHELLKEKSKAGLKLVLIEHRPALLEIYDSEKIQHLVLREGRMFSS